MSPQLVVPSETESSIGEASGRESGSELDRRAITPTPADNPEAGASETPASSKPKSLSADTTPRTPRRRVNKDRSSSDEDEGERDNYTDVDEESNESESSGADVEEDDADEEAYSAEASIQTKDEISDFAAAEAAGNKRRRGSLRGNLLRRGSLVLRARGSITGSPVPTRRQLQVPMTLSRKISYERLIQSYTDCSNTLPMLESHPIQTPRLRSGSNHETSVIVHPVRPGGSDRSLQYHHTQAEYDNPAAPTPDGPMPLSTILHGRLSAARILLAEDNATNQLVAVRILSRLGYRCDVADNGLQAVQAVSTTPYELILMDMRMPVMDGLTATRKIREMEAEGRTASTTPCIIIAMTADAVLGVKEECLEAGMQDYITKPVKPDALREKLARYLGSETQSPLRKPIPIDASGGRRKSSPSPVTHHLRVSGFVPLAISAPEVPTSTSDPSSPIAKRSTPPSSPTFPSLLPMSITVTEPSPPKEHHRQPTPPSSSASLDSASSDVATTTTVPPLAKTDESSLKEFPLPPLLTPIPLADSGITLPDPDDILMHISDSSALRRNTTSPTKRLKSSSETTEDSS